MHICTLEKYIKYFNNFLNTRNFVQTIIKLSKNRPKICVSLHENLKQVHLIFNKLYKIALNVLYTHELQQILFLHIGSKLNGKKLHAMRI